MQQLELLFLDDISRITIDRANSLIVNTWLKQVEHDEMLRTGVKLNHLLRQTNTRNLLLSALQLGCLAPETKEWLATTYYKSLSELGLRKVARVLPENLFNKLSFEAVVTRAEALGAINFEVRNFATDKAAMNWLLE